MTLMTHRKLWTAGSACLLALSSAAAVTFATAQGPMLPPAPPGVAAGTPTVSGSAMPAKTYTKSQAFHLPIRMPEATRQTLSQVQLYVKPPGGQWVKQDAVLPTAPRFSFKAPADGEYWFSLVTIDRHGKATPANVTVEPPEMRVVVDTQPPVIDVQVMPGAEGEALVRCTMQDANPDPASLRAFSRGSVGEIALEALPGQAGVFRVRAEMTGMPVRVIASDLAGNTSTREVNVRDSLVVTKPVPSLLPTPTEPIKALIPDAVVAQAPIVPPMLTPIGGAEKSAVTPPNPTTLNPTTLEPPMMAKMPTLPADGPATGKPAPANRKLIRTTHASIDYRIDQVGASGVGKVEIYITHDQGSTWRRVGEDTDRQSPAEVELPGEGVFGVRLAITNGNGFGGTPPGRGDAPHCWVEVDTTPPFVQLRPTEVVPGGGVLDIRWSASDPNLGNEPVSLYYRTKNDAAWLLIARGIKNDGSYRWTFPRDAGSQFYFKVEVADLAGNVATSESQTPLLLDMTEPRASVIGISAAGKSQ